MKMKTVLALCAVLFSMGTLAANDKVVVANLQAAILQTDIAKNQLQALEADAEFAAMKAKYDSLRADLANMEKDANTNGMTWTEQQIADHRKKMDYKAADLKLVAEKLKAEQGVVLKKIIQQHAQNAESVLKDIMKSEKIGLVLKHDAAVIADPSHDITALITEKLNKAK